MELTDFATQLKAKNQFIKASFGGFAGSGKSRTATEFIIGTYKQLKCTKPILIIDNEKGSRFLIPLFKKAGIEVMVKDTLQLADILKAFDFLNKGEIDFLFIDSLTKVWYQYIKNYRANNKRVFMTLQDWGKILPAWQEQFANNFIELNGNCVFTGRGGYTYDMDEDDKGKKQFVKSGVKMKMAGETPFEPDLNVWMDIVQKIDEGRPSIWREALILKDRSSLIDGMTFKNPTYTNFAPVIDFLIDIPKGDVAGETDQSNLTPKENYDYQKERDAREIQLELIKNEFIKAGLSGNGKEVTQHKIRILEILAGTSSWSAIERIESFELKVIKTKIQTLLLQYPDATDKTSFIESFNEK